MQLMHLDIRKLTFIILYIVRLLLPGLGSDFVIKGETTGLTRDFLPSGLAKHRAVVLNLKASRSNIATAYGKANEQVMAPPNTRVKVTPAAPKDDLGYSPLPLKPTPTVQHQSVSKPQGRPSRPRRSTRNMRIYRINICMR